MSDIKFPPAYQKFWMAFEVSDTKLRLFRFAFFALFALDAWLQIAHAPRYGANDFNVTHFPWMDFVFPMPSRTMMLVVFSVQAYLGARIALGGVSRAIYIALAALFAFGYYISQLNSLQHHYLLSIALCLFAAFPWPDLQKPPAGKEASPRERKARRQANWPIRMLLVSFSVMYFYAAISKMHPLWTDGTTLKLELSAEWMRDICDTLGWGTMAVLTIVAELVLVVLIHIRRAWPLAIVLGVGMHMSFEHSGLEIGLFSYFMVALYMLLLPEKWLAALSRWTAPGLSALSELVARADSKPLLAWLSFGGALALAFALIPLLPFPVGTMTTVFVVCAILALADFAQVRRGASAALTHLVALLSLLLFLHSTDAVRDYYRYWGGQERRSGNISTAIIAYEDLVRYEPGYAQGHRRLGDLYRRVKRNDEALEEYEAGLALDAENFALNQGAAQLYHLFGRGQEALRCAERGLKSKPADKALLGIRNHWKKEL